MLTVMNSYEVINRTVNFQNPDRLGMHYFVNDQWHSDIYHDSAENPDFDEKRRVEEGLEKWQDVWGNTWARVAQDKTTKGEVYQGVLSDWDDLETFILPDLANPAYYQSVKQRFHECESMYKLAELPGFCFSLARKMRRLDNFLMDILLEKEKVKLLMDRMYSLLCDMAEQYALAGANGLFFCEDWGTQTQLLINPAIWEEMFEPYFTGFCDHAAKHNLTVWMHSCGYIYDIIPNLIRAGVKVLQFDQPELMGIEKLGRSFAGQVTFWSPCDVQKVLPTGDYRLIEDSIRKMCTEWFKNGGGFIAKAYGTSNKDLYSIGVKPQWNEFAYECFCKYAAGCIS